MSDIHFHRRNLPHFYRPNATYFITFRLHGTIPKEKIAQLRYEQYEKQPAISKEERYQQDKVFFKEYDMLLHKNRIIYFLNDEKIVKIVKESLHFYDH